MEVVNSLLVLTTILSLGVALFFLATGELLSSNLRVPDNLALALGHCSQPPVCTHVTLPDDIVTIIGRPQLRSCPDSKPALGM